MNYYYNRTTAADRFCRQAAHPNRRRHFVPPPAPRRSAFKVRAICMSLAVVVMAIIILSLS